MVKENVIDSVAMDVLFDDARTYNGWIKKDVSDDLIKQLHEHVKFGATSANCCPARFVFLKSDAAKQRLKPFLDAGNVDKTMAAPVVAIIGYDMEFYEHLPRLFPHADAKSWFAGNDVKIRDAAERNGTLQGAYLMMVARALGLDCGPMSGFDKGGVEKEFFAGTKIEANFLCNLGYGDPESLFPRSPRFDFDDVNTIL